MITKTTTAARFLYNWEGVMHQYGKEHYDNALQQFIEPTEDIELEVFLENLLLHKDLMVADNVANIKIEVTFYYDTYCGPEISEKAIALLQELGARLSVRAQRNFEGETLYQVLDRIRERPAMYIGEASISALRPFIDGFFMACNGGTKEVPDFHGFNDFVGEYYGKSTTAGWKNLILADHFGNEQEALRRFYEILDDFRAMRNAPSSRNIVHRLLNVAFIHFRGESNEIGKTMMQDDDDIIKNAKEIRAELWKINRVADLLHNATNPMKHASYSFEYDDILQHIFGRAFNYPYLHQYIKTNAPEAAFYEYELWQGTDGGKVVTTIVKVNKTQKELLLTANETLIRSFFAINENAANELKDHFVNHQLLIKEQNKILHQHHLSFFTEYYQFYIQDSQTTSATGDTNFWNAEADKNRLAVVEGLLGVTVGKYAEIKVEVRVLTSKPMDHDYPDHVVEASLNLPSGILQVKCCTNFDTQLELHLEKGCYRVRVSSFKLYTIKGDEGDDSYIVEIWKSRAAKTKVLTKYKI
jgi:hypothetical protein